MMKKFPPDMNGLSIKNFNDIKVGDIVEGFEELEVKKTSIKFVPNFIEELLSTI